MISADVVPCSTNSNPRVFKSPTALNHTLWLQTPPLSDPQAQSPTSSLFRGVVFFGVHAFKGPSFVLRFWLAQKPSSVAVGRPLSHFSPFGFPPPCPDTCLQSAVFGISAVPLFETLLATAEQVVPVPIPFYGTFRCLPVFVTFLQFFLDGNASFNVVTARLSFPRVLLPFTFFFSLTVLCLPTSEVSSKV